MAKSSKNKGFQYTPLMLVETLIPMFFACVNLGAQVVRENFDKVFDIAVWVITFVYFLIGLFIGIRVLQKQKKVFVPYQTEGVRYMSAAMIISGALIIFYAMSGFVLLAIIGIILGWICVGTIKLIDIIEKR